jgi:hypothetical protein
MVSLPRKLKLGILMNVEGGDPYMSIIWWRQPWSEYFLDFIIVLYLCFKCLLVYHI